MLSGLLAGAFAAIVASLLSLPLHSPDDAFLNTATITIGSLVAGVLAGVLRDALTQRNFVFTWGALFLAKVAGLAAAEAFVFERMLSFGVPIAAVVFLITGAGVIFLRATRLPMAPVTSGVAVFAAIALGLGLAGRGDAESGELSLPAAPSGTTSAQGTGVARTTGPGAAGTAVGGVPSTFTKQDDLKGVTFVIGEGSQATFTVNEKLAQLTLPNDAVMKSTAVTGEIRLDGRPTKVTLDTTTLTSDQPRRDQFVQRSLFSKAPAAVLTIPAITSLPASYTPGETVKQQVTGTLQINGVEKPMAFDVEARIDGQTLNVLGRSSFVWKDFNMTAPNTPTVSVQDQVAVQVLLVAKATAS